MAEIEDTLRELDRWYNELPGGTDRPKLLSKLAMLELCGWLEHRLDLIVYAIGDAVGLERSWVEKMASRNSGFTYQEHLRKMIERVIGEFAILHIEQVFEQTNPGTLDQLKGALTALWKSRTVLAHTHTGAPVIAQVQANAPSWAINQQRIVGRMLSQFEQCLPNALNRTIVHP